MGRTRHFLAVDLGASNGRVLLGRWDGARFELSEVHRFANEPVGILDHLHWDVLSLWNNVKDGIARHAAEHRGQLDGLGLDTWGVDFALLDRDDRLLGNPYHYRDRRTDRIPELVYEVVPARAIFEATGIQPMQINTLFQLYAMARAGDAQLAVASRLLPLPNLFYYWLTGERVAEYTHATTSQCLDVRARRWSSDLLERLGLPVGLFPGLVEPGTILGGLRREVVEEVGLPGAPMVISVGTHDTASAVAAIPGLDSNSAYISSGTWSLMGVELPEPIVNDRSFGGSFTNEGGVAGTTRLLKNIGGLWLIQECRRHWRRAGSDYSWDDLLALAQRAAPFRAFIDPDAPEFLSPPDMPAAIRAACVASGQEEPEGVGAIVRCCLESLAVRYRATLEDLEAVTGRRLTTIRIVGGGSQNRLLCQLTADACGVPVAAGPVEAAALGNVMVQAIASGELDDVASGREAIGASTEIRTYEPRPGGAWEEGLARLRVREDARSQ